MKTKTNVKAGRITANHNEKVACGLRVRTAVKVGRITANHNETVASRLRGCTGREGGAASSSSVNR